jgi:hypothetical protein
MAILTGSRTQKEETAFVFLKTKIKSKCFADAEAGKPMDSLEDTLTTQPTLFTLCVMESLQGWDHTFSIQSSGKRSITAASPSPEIKFIRSMLMESKARSVLRPPDSTKNTTSLMEKQSFLKMTALSTRNISSSAKKLTGTNTRRVDQRIGSITTTSRLLRNRLIRIF